MTRLHLPGLGPERKTSRKSRPKLVRVCKGIALSDAPPITTPSHSLVFGNIGADDCEKLARNIDKHLGSCRFTGPVLKQGLLGCSVGVGIVVPSNSVATSAPTQLHKCIKSSVSAVNMIVHDATRAIGEDMQLISSLHISRLEYVDRCISERYHTDCCIVVVADVKESIIGWCWTESVGATCGPRLGPFTFDITSFTGLGGNDSTLLHAGTQAHGTYTELHQGSCLRVAAGSMHFIVVSKNVRTLYTCKAFEHDGKELNEATSKALAAYGLGQPRKVNDNIHEGLEWWQMETPIAKRAKVEEDCSGDKVEEDRSDDELASIMQCD